MVIPTAGRTMFDSNAVGGIGEDCAALFFGVPQRLSKFSTGKNLLPLSPMRPLISPVF